MLGIEAEYTHFDPEIIVNINTVLMSLYQLGVGETSYFLVDGTETWEDFLGDFTNLEGIKTYIYMKVRLLFDPPANSFVLDAMERQIAELEFRINVQVDVAEEEEELE